MEIKGDDRQIDFVAKSENIINLTSMVIDIRFDT